MSPASHRYDRITCHRWHQADLGYGEDRERAGQSRLLGVVEAASIEFQNSAVRSGKIKYQAALRPDCRSITFRHSKRRTSFPFAVITLKVLTRRTR
jgi:hypothetical protein